MTDEPARERLSLHVAPARPDDEVGDFAAYLSLPAHPGRGVGGCVKRSVRLSEVAPYRGGPTIMIDFDVHDKPIGIEILN